jgi:hypothetical protein
MEAWEKTLEECMELLEDFYSPGDAWVWLYSPQAVLGGDMPVNLIRKGQAERVRQAIAQLRDSVYL